MDCIRLLFAQIQAPPPSMHHKWKEIIDIGCKTSDENSLVTSSPVDLMDNCNEHNE